jgi:hypothetical protein
METLGNYGVESFHITVHTGDCAIHLMIRESQALKPLILAAVLIDGGSKRMQGNAPSPIGEVIPWIQNHYRTGQPDNVLKFSAVVVTHWDEDHEAGLLNFFFDGVKKEGSGDKHPNLIYEYEPDSGKLTPMTWLYAPYWEGYTHKWSDQWVKGKPLYMSCDIDGIVKMLILESIKDEPFKLKMKNVPTFRLRTQEIINTYGIVGVNLFNNQLIDKTLAGSIQNLDGLLEANPPTNPSSGTASDEIPGLYILAANRWLLGPDEQLSWEYDPPGVPWSERTAPTITNQSSIVAVVLWKTHISHYMAGDADSLLEEEILKTMVLSTKTKITSMKLSHHGSRYSTPLSMIAQFEPENIVVSNPRWGNAHPGKPIALLQGSTDIWKLGNLSGYWMSGIVPTNRQEKLAVFMQLTFHTTYIGRRNLRITSTKPLSSRCVQAHSIPN